MRFARILTTLGVTCACGLALLHAGSIIGFSVAGASVDAKQISNETLAQWSSVAGSAIAAREAAQVNFAERRIESTDCEHDGGLAKILAEKPLSADHWLSLAECRLLRGDNADKVAEAWRLSLLTGANQRYVMMRRAVFALSHWDQLPSEWQDSAGADFSTEIVGREVSELAAAFAGQSETTRRKISMALQAQRVDTKTLLAIGF